MSVADNAELHESRLATTPAVHRRALPLRIERTYKSPLAGFRVDTIFAPANTSMFTLFEIQR
ncbi:hypothetical protein [Caballeronia temeraria]|uniref:hypothetical protein n=1 Tax=Caballeronia temeraria TaxID=1777137 RepID=UPI0012FE1FE8|nr:hypothetical protein [Caballeronia temeraria]